MKIDLFGPPRLYVQGKIRQHSSRKAMALLAYLSMRAGQPVMREHLATLLWGDTGSEQARVNLRQSLSQLRSLLGDEACGALCATGDQIVLDPNQFNISARDLLGGTCEEVAVLIASGPGFLEGFNTRSEEFDTWITAERHLLETRLCDVLEVTGRDRLSSGDAAGAARNLALALKLDPFREAAHRNLMQAQADLGKTSAALVQFEKCRAILKSQLGVEPDAETRALAARIRASRLRSTAQIEPAPEIDMQDIDVIVFREECQKSSKLLGLTRGAVADAIQAALDFVRSEGTTRTARLVAVQDTGDPVADLEVARGLLARHAGYGFVVSDKVRRVFEDRSPFSFEKAQSGAGDVNLLLGEMPRDRYQVMPTICRPSVKISTGSSIVILPFRDHSPVADRLNLGEVLAEEMIARMARFRHFKVSGPTAGQTCRALGLSAEQIHERMGVSYAVDGSVTRLGDRLLITYSITDLKSDQLVYGDRFEGKFDDLFEQQSVLVDRIASALFNRTEQAEIDRLAARLTNDIGAYECYLFGLSAHRRSGIALQNARKAVGHFEDAIRIDPEFVRAHAQRLCAMSWYDPDTAYGVGLSEIDRLVAMDDNDPEIHRIAASLHLFQGDYDIAVDHIDRAVELNPSDGYLIANSAISRLYADDKDGALSLIKRAMDVDPFLPAWCVEDHGVVLYARGDYSGAVASLRRLSLPSPRALSYLAAAYVALDDQTSAKLAADRVVRISPEFTRHQITQFELYRDHDTRNLLAARMARAGIA